MTKAEQEWSLIEALEYCKKKRPFNKSCAGCPYAGVGCGIDAAIEKLKAQEPRLMTLEEIVKWDGAFWLEFLEDDNENYTRYGYAFFSGSTPYVVEVIARDSFRPLYAFIKCEYGKRWRCWTSCPDNATREATPWN